MNTSGAVAILGRGHEECTRNMGSAAGEVGNGIAGVLIVVRPELAECLNELLITRKPRVHGGDEGFLLHRFSDHCTLKLAVSCLSDENMLTPPMNFRHS